MGGKEFPLSLIIRAVDKATAPLRKVSERIEGLGKSARRVGSALSVGVTAPLVALGGVSLAAFSKFQDGMANVSTLIDTSTENLQAMGKEVLGIAKRTPVALDNLAAGLYDIRSAGISAADQFKVLEGSARLAVVGLGSTQEAVDLVTSAINAFNLQGEDQARIYNMIFQATNTGKTTISGLARGFGGVAGTVAAAGVKIDEYLASVAALTTTGLPAAEAHTQLRAVLSGLTRQGKETQRLFKSLGAKDLPELIRNSGGLVPAMNRIKTALRGNSTEMLNILGSTEALNAVISLTGNQAGAFDTALGAMKNNLTGMDDAFALKDATIGARWQRLQNTLQGVAVSVGERLVPALERLLPYIERAADWMGSLSDSALGTMVAFAGAAAALGPTLTIVGNLGTVFSTANDTIKWAKDWGGYLWMMRGSIMSGLVPSLTAAATSVWGFTAALLANPITWVVAAIAGAAYLIYKNWDDISLFFKFLWEDVTEIFESVWAWIKEAIPGWTPLGLIIKNWEPIKRFFADLWEGVVGVFKSAWDKISPIIDGVVQFAKSSFIGKAFGFVGDVFSTGRIGRAKLWDAEASRPVLGAESVPTGGAVQSTEARVTVDFNNLPPGTRVASDPRGTAPIELNRGYSLVTP